MTREELGQPPLQHARVLPETSGRLAKLKTGAEALMALPADAF